MSFDEAFRARLRDLLFWRRDVRRFRHDPLPSGTLEALIELACLAPSVGLSQPWRFRYRRRPNHPRRHPAEFCDL
jgi:5,6-dimethylbenzimidazole synthase